MCHRPRVSWGRRLNRLGGRADLRPRTGWNRPSLHPRERGAAAGVAHQAEDSRLSTGAEAGTRAPSSASLPRAVVPDGRGVVRASWLTDLGALWGPLEGDDSAGDVAVRGGQAARACSQSPPHPLTKVRIISPGGSHRRSRIVAGETRYKAAVLIGLTAAPVVTIRHARRAHSASSTTGRPNSRPGTPTSYLTRSPGWTTWTSSRSTTSSASGNGRQDGPGRHPGDAEETYHAHRRSLGARETPDRVR